MTKPRIGNKGKMSFSLLTATAVLGLFLTTTVLIFSIN
tara:strand:- start:912 stop:1025 length:114 start_codon:yes stop_codon:yes gene_type:complete